MARPGITQIVMSLTTDPMKAIWKRVKDHYGDEYSNSHVLFDLVRVKDNEIIEKLTNRERFKSIDARLARIERHLEIEEDDTDVPRQPNDPQ